MVGPIVPFLLLGGRSIDAFGGDLRMLELAAPASPAPDEVVTAVNR